MMARISHKTEEALPYEEILRQRHEAMSHTIPDAISHAACYTALDIGAKAIICCTQSGYTALMVAKYRPKPVIIAVTPLETTYRRLALSWSVLSLKIDQTQNTDDMMEKAKIAAREAGLLDTGDVVVLTAGVPIGVPGKTNIIKADVIEQRKTTAKPPMDAN
jgi:pyruvate kinase